MFSGLRRFNSTSIMAQAKRGFAMQQALVLEEKGKLSMREIDFPETMGPRDVRIDIKRVGICGSDVHYYTRGAIGHFVVNEPMVLGHEASGLVSEVGPEVTEFKVGDRVCMEPGIPDPQSKAARLGMYNLGDELT
jgi:D-xylulose reductase